jgi:hypothetical protein
MISVAPVVHWARFNRSLAQGGAVRGMEIRTSDPHAKAAKKLPVQNGRNVPKQRPERPDRIVDFSPVDKEPIRRLPH